MLAHWLPVLEGYPIFCSLHLKEQFTYKLKLCLFTHSHVISNPNYVIFLFSRVFEESFMGIFLHLLGAFYAKQLDLYHWKKNTGLEQHEGQ